MGGKKRRQDDGSFGIKPAIAQGEKLDELLTATAGLTLFREFVVNAK